VLWAAGYLFNMFTVERFDGDCRPIYAFRGIPYYVARRNTY